MRRHYALIDTNHWVYIAQDPALLDLLQKIEFLVERKHLVLVVPETVKAEFSKQSSETEQRRYTTSLKDQLKSARKIVSSYSSMENKNELLDLLSKEISSITTTYETEYSRRCKAVARVLDHRGSVQISVSNAAKLAAADRALGRLAPMHRKNSFADALIIEAYGDFLKSVDLNHSTAYFITNNRSDFSSTSDERVPHENLHQFFESENSIYSIDLINVIDRINDDVHAGISIEKLVRETYRDLGRSGVTGLHPTVCYKCGNNDFLHSWGASPYGGPMWYYRCTRCGMKYFTGDWVDDN